MPWSDEKSKESEDYTSVDVDVPSVMDEVLYPSALSDDKEYSQALHSGDPEEYGQVLPDPENSMTNSHSRELMNRSLSASERSSVREAAPTVHPAVRKIGNVNSDPPREYRRSEARDGRTVACFGPKRNWFDGANRTRAGSAIYKWTEE